MDEPIKQRMRKISEYGSLILLLSICVEQLAWGAQLYRSAFHLGRGDAGIAVADEQEAIYYNPAGLAGSDKLYVKTVLLSPQIGLSSQVHSIYQDLVLDEKDQIEVLKNQIGKPYHLDFSNVTTLIFKRVAIGVLSDAKADFRVFKSREQRGVETLFGRFEVNQVLSFSVAESFFNKQLNVGITGKYIQRGEAKIEEGLVDASAIKDINTDRLVKQGQGQGIDLGLMWKGSKGVRGNSYQLGLMISDLGQTDFGAAEDSPSPLSQHVSFGSAYMLETPYASLKLLADYKDLFGEDTLSAFKRLHLGATVQFLSLLGVSAGFNQGYFTAGMFTNIRFVRLDLGYYTEEAGRFVGMTPDKRIVLRVQAAI